MKCITLTLSAAALFLASCQNNYYSIDDFGKVPKIDAHVHVNCNSTALSMQALDDNFRIINVNVEVPAMLPLEDQYKIAVNQHRATPEIVSFLSSFTMKDWDKPSWDSTTTAFLRKSFQEGALGIKIWKNIGMVERASSGNMITLDHPRFDSIANLIISENKTILGHLGEPRNCWLPLEDMTVNNDREYFARHPEYLMYLHPELPSYQDHIDARDRFLSRHPNLRFVGAHLGSLEWDVDELAAHLDRFPNMAVDVADRICHLQHQSVADYEKVRNFVIRYHERLIYGTDVTVSPGKSQDAFRKDVHETWLHDWKYFTSDEKMMTAPQVNGTFRALRLPKEVVDNIYYNNARKWFGISDVPRGEKTD